MAGEHLVVPWPSAPASPRTLPVNVPFPDFGVTVVTLDRDGNVTIRVDQHQPDPS